MRSKVYSFRFSVLMQLNISFHGKETVEVGSCVKGTERDYVCMDGVRKAKDKLEIKRARIKDEKKVSSKYMGNKRKLRRIIKQFNF